MTDIESSFVESLTQRFEISKSAGLLVWKLLDHDTASHSLVDFFLLARPANNHGNSMTVPDKLSRIGENDFTNAVVNEVVYDHADVH